MCHLAYKLTRVEVEVFCPFLTSTQKWNAPPPWGVLPPRVRTSSALQTRGFMGPTVNLYVVVKKAFSVVPINQLVVNTSTELSWLLHYIYKLVSEI